MQTPHFPNCIFYIISIQVLITNCLPIFSQPFKDKTLNMYLNSIMNFTTIYIWNEKNITCKTLKNFWSILKFVDSTPPFYLLQNSNITILYTHIVNYSSNSHWNILFKYFLKFFGLVSILLMDSGNSFISFEYLYFQNNSARNIIDLDLI